MKLVFASGHRGYELKEYLYKYAKESSYNVKNLGSDDNNKIVDYPYYAKLLCNFILENKDYYGILICSTGIGMSIAANRYSEIRAALCLNDFMAKKAKQHNNANVLILAAKLVSNEEALMIFNEFLNNKFDGGRHFKRISQLS